MKICQYYHTNVYAGFTFVTSTVEKEKAFVKILPVEGGSYNDEGLVYLCVYS